MKLSASADTYALQMLLKLNSVGFLCERASLIFNAFRCKSRSAT